MRRSSSVSWPAGVIAIVLPAAKGPEMMSAFHSSHVATSDHSRRVDSGVTVVSMLCSVVRIGGG